MDKDKEYWIVLPFTYEDTARKALQEIRDQTGYTGSVIEEDRNTYLDKKKEKNETPHAYS